MDRFPGDRSCMDHSAPPINDSERRLLREGIQCFNQGKFFECHEVLEEAWLGAAGDQKRFLQGLIQIAVAFHHLSKKNPIGAGRLLSSGIEKLSGFPPQHEGVEVAGLLAALGPLLDRLRSGDDGFGDANFEPPRILCDQPSNSQAG